MLDQRISHYQIVEKIGEGGMGVVWKARDTELGRFVALKTLPAGKTGDDARRQRFIQEARAASALNHPNIVTIYDILHRDGASFLVMEYIDGRTLDQLIPKSGMRLTEALRVAAQVAAALEAAHAAGIVHRDLKPGNVMVTGAGAVKVLDFGLAKLMEKPVASEDGATLTIRPSTEEGIILGTVAYMSPEQAEGKPVDARSDIFSFGAMLYEMLTGQRAFQGQSKLSTLSAILHKDPRPARELSQNLPLEVDKLVARCLRKDAARRWHHMVDIRVALEDLKEESDSGTLSGALGTVVTAPPRRRWLVPALAVLALAAVGLVSWSLVSKRNAPAPAMKLVPLTSYPGIEGEPTFSPDGNQFAFSWDGEKQDNPDIYVRMIAGGTPLRLTNDPAADTSPAWSPDGRRIAFMRQLSPTNRLAVMLISPLGGQERQLAEIERFRGLAVTSTLDWSPDGRWLSSHCGSERGLTGSLCFISAETGELRRLPTGSSDFSPAFSPDGRSLAFLRRTGANLQEIYLLRINADYHPAGEPFRLTNLHQNIQSPVWTSDGQEVVFASGRVGNMSLWRQGVKDIAARPIDTSGRHEIIYSAAVSRQGRLAFSAVTRELRVVRVDLAGPGGPVSRTTPIGATTLTDRYPVWSADGSRIAFSSDRSGNWEIWTCTAEGGNPFQVTSMGGPEATRPAWSPDGRRLAFSADVEEQRQIFVVPSAGGVPKQMTHQVVSQDFPFWSSDGRWIYFSSGQGSQNSWRKMPSDGGEPVSFLSGAVRLQASPDGKDLYFLRQGHFLRMPVSGGPETEVFSSDSGFNFSVGTAGIYFISGATVQTPGTLFYYPFSGGSPREIAGVDRPSQYGLSLSPDGRSLLYAQFSRVAGDIWMLENFR